MYECKSGQSRIGRFGAGSDKARSGKTKPDQEAGLIGPDQAKTKKSCPTHCRLHCYEPELKRLITRGPGSTQMSALGPHIAQTISSIPSTLNPPSTFDAANTSNISKTSHTHQVLVVLMSYPLWGLNPHLLLVYMIPKGHTEKWMEAS